MLVHDASCFARETILKRASEYGFPNPLAVEMFAWDCEVAAQFQTESDDVIVKGGMAAQVQLPIEVQRGSIDVDLLASLEKDNVEKILAKLVNNVPDTSYEPIIPTNPVPKLPMVSYRVNVPASIEYMGRKSLQIKADFLLDNFNLPTIQLRKVRTFAIDVSRVKCYTRPVLVGDKLLTLAKGSIGMQLDIDYPKQMYDLDMLTKIQLPNTDELKTIVSAVQALSEAEANYRGIKNTTGKFLQDVILTMTNYGKVDTSLGDSAIKTNIRKFQELFVSQNQKLTLEGWSIRALRIRLLAKLVRDVIGNSLSYNDAYKILEAVNSIAVKLNATTGRDTITNRRNSLMSLQKARLPYFKELRGKPLERVFWEVVDINNLNEIQAILE